MNFWENKIPCWEIKACGESACERCPAYTTRRIPCWEIQGTLCEKLKERENFCANCEVYLKYGPREVV